VDDNKSFILLVDFIINSPFLWMGSDV